MVNYYLTCRSLTYAQRSSRVLAMAGVRNTIVRTPANMSSEGCGYAVRIRAGQLGDAAKTLEEKKLMPRRIFIVYEDGRTEEIHL